MNTRHKLYVLIISWYLFFFSSMNLYWAKILRNLLVLSGVFVWIFHPPLRWIQHCKFQSSIFTSYNSLVKSVKRESLRTGALTKFPHMILFSAICIISDRSSKQVTCTVLKFKAVRRNNFEPESVLVGFEQKIINFLSCNAIMFLTSRVFIPCYALKFRYQCG